MPGKITKKLLLLIAGAKGAVGSTVAAAAAVMQNNPEFILPCLTTGHSFNQLASPGDIWVGGWDKSLKSMSESLEYHGVIPERIWKSCSAALNEMPVLEAPESGTDPDKQVDHLVDDIGRIKALHSDSHLVFINLLPAIVRRDFSACQTLSHLYANDACRDLPDFAYTLAAVLSGIPVVNFSPNEVEIQPVIDESIQRGVPIAGRDGKTGQTYLKVVLASALKARNLIIDGWYSLNILGNADGENLMDPECAEGKLRHKTDLLNDILGYKVGKDYNAPTHKVHIDYYPPRGDAKEAWDVIDFQGLFGLPMSLRVNLLGRDSILAAPLVIDLARWMTALKLAGRSGPIPELAFFFKKPVGDNAAVTFQDQLNRLHQLERECFGALK